MAFNPPEFVNLAQAVVTTPALHAEARARTAIGRAYYGLFLAVRAAIRVAEGRSADDGMAKGHLPSVLFSSKKDELIAVGMLLDSLYSLRRRADYILSPQGDWARKLSDPAYVEVRVKEAQALIKRLPTLDFTPVRGKL